MREPNISKQQLEIMWDQAQQKDPVSKMLKIALLEYTAEGEKLEQLRAENERLRKALQDFNWLQENAVLIEKDSYVNAGTWWSIYTKPGAPGVPLAGYANTLSKAIEMAREETVPFEDVDGTAEGEAADTEALRQILGEALNSAAEGEQK